MRNPTELVRTYSFVNLGRDDPYKFVNCNFLIEESRSFLENMRLPIITSASFIDTVSSTDIPVNG